MKWSLKKTYYQIILQRKRQKAVRRIKWYGLKIPCHCLPPSHRWCRMLVVHVFFWKMLSEPGCSWRNFRSRHYCWHCCHSCMWYTDLVSKCLFTHIETVFVPSLSLAKGLFGLRLLQDSNRLNDLTNTICYRVYHFFSFSLCLAATRDLNANTVWHY